MPRKITTSHENISGVFLGAARGEAFSFLLEHGPQHALVIDDAGIIRYCDPRLRKRIGYGWQGELVNGETPFAVLVPPRVRADHSKWLDTWFDNPAPGQRGQEMALRCKDGSEIPVWGWVYPWEWLSPVNGSGVTSVRLIVCYFIFKDDMAKGRTNDGKAVLS